ncbi:MULTISPECIES: hypothetical protein [unclassified Pseudoalteromonas]|uniref:hypothetical protein n=1 Tax=unclassified Pseudoalteromonas TaxID=194690 RepID=UPI000C7AF301|nr:MULTISPECIES: hypothetical protein [unclassified Pseudoalteromonas]AUJ70912.1 hypothetical protein PNC201_13260 [Pseudoalteromonas sp. NC201]MCF2825212.1 hypothetical protein [Pseudoalteromonas sp. OF5H-5]MCF2832306.1 hypothetical protein [Pseudoalteromonas sp. DL2-H6]MCF2927008.1 hypothetical protein [Pseudoalteromonas sp. DL2-H1]MCF7512316.1 hypothetical protein [Pseudoalteromonas sp. L7]
MNYIDHIYLKPGLPVAKLTIAVLLLFSAILYKSSLLLYIGFYMALIVPAWDLLSVVAKEQGACAKVTLITYCKQHWIQLLLMLAFACIGIAGLHLEYLLLTLFNIAFAMLLAAHVIRIVYKIRKMSAIDAIKERLKTKSRFILSVNLVLIVVMCTTPFLSIPVGALAANYMVIFSCYMQYLNHIISEDIFETD